MIRQLRLASTLAIIAATAGLAAPASAQVAGVPLEMEPNTCDRACLENFVERYLQAMSDGTVSDDLFARSVRFTENGVELPLGNEGLWATTVSPEGYRLVVPDVTTGQVTALVTVQEQANSSATGPQRPAEHVGLSLRLRIDREGKITEVEQIAARPDRPLGAATGPSTDPFPATGAAVHAIGSPWPGYLQAVPEAERHTRAELVEVANAYFEAVERNTGNDYYPFTEDCLRLENGMIAAASDAERAALPDRPAFGTVQTCKGQFETSLIGTVTSVRDRRVLAVDEERGIVFASAFFDHRPINWSWHLGELFKVEGGMITRIEAIFIRNTYGMCSGWSTYAQCRSEEVQDVR
ncbi:hypothetical protein M3P36_01190 [Altererythrobacter sp. KTW20L]|uniref:hypothetical protein n=1 Tax=Altererythrobacter sp. KTW20L TaxID=2942210 RepID=UPI0020C02AAE|nr:hypothetical protein [Altererythrobacter sp. KTW20L]MCL6249664.1 hypothetical protein [Altererythrobacter sp. KTW20L]